MHCIYLYHSDKHEVMLIQKRPRRMASQPPAPIPAIVSNTSQGPGFLWTGTPFSLAIVSRTLFNIRSVDMACSPPPSRVMILRGSECLEESIMVWCTEPRNAKQVVVVGTRRISVMFGATKRYYKRTLQMASLLISCNSKQIEDRKHRNTIVPAPLGIEPNTN